MTAVLNSLPEIAVVTPGTAAARAGLQVGDRVHTVNGVVPRDIIEWHFLVSNDSVEIVAERDLVELEVVVERHAGEPFGAEVSSALFDRVQTCDNHCEFCFIYQLPEGMRRSLYLKDDDYRLSFLYGNFTTLTRFTEADFERIVSQRLSPLYVSIHATEPTTRSEMLRNSRGGFSLRWLKELGKNGIEARGQIVLCPGVNDASVLERTCLDLIDQFAFLSSVAIVPLGLSRHNSEKRMRVHTKLEALRVVEQVRAWQDFALRILGRRFFYLADEFYLLAEHPIPSSIEYDGFEMVEDGIGIARQFLDSFRSPNREIRDSGPTPAQGFFASVDAKVNSASQNPTDYVANPAADTSFRRAESVPVSLRTTTKKLDKLTVLTGECAAPVLIEAIREFADDRVSVHPIPNKYFGGNTSVAGLLTGTDIIDYLTSAAPDATYVIPSVCLNQDRFLDGVHIDDVRCVRNVDVVPTDGAALWRYLDDFRRHTRVHTTSTDSVNGDRE